MPVWMCGWVCAHEYRCLQRSKTSVSPELEFKMVVRSCLRWVLGTELRFSGRTIRALNYKAMSPGLMCVHGYEYRRVQVKGQPQVLVSTLYQI